MQSDSMSDGQDISLQGAYRQDQGAKLEVKPTDYSVFELLLFGAPIGACIGIVGVYGYIWKKAKEE